jgi:hypothetical protein
VGDGQDTGWGHLTDELTLFLSAAGADPERVETLTGRLRRELDHLDLVRMTLARTGQAPEVTRELELLNSHRRCRAPLALEAGRAVSTGGR